MVGPRVFGTTPRPDRLQGAHAASRGRSRPGHHSQRGRSARLATARQARHGGDDPQPARLGLPAGRSETGVISSISRQLILWLAIPLMLVALCGALIHYFNNVAPVMISSERRLKDAANSLVAHVSVKQGQVALDLNPYVKPFLPSADSTKYALRDSAGRLLAGDDELPPVAMGSEGTELLALAQLGGRGVRTLTTRFNTAAGPLTLTVADIRKTSEPEARLGLMS